MIINVKTQRNSKYSPSVSLLIPCHNEAKCIKDKIENSLSIDYPEELFEIIIASDNSSDNTVELAKYYERKNNRVKVLDFKERSGKMGTLKKTVKFATGDILVLTDANTMFVNNTIKELTCDFSDKDVGCVCGAKNIVSEADVYNGTDKEEKKYWKYECFIKSGETKSGSCVGADGSVYAIRKNLFPNVPENILVMDDLLVSLMIYLEGFRCIFNPKAQAYEDSTQEISDEFKRKVRIFMGALSVVVYLPKLFISPIVFKLVSHKILRWSTPVFMITLLISSFFLRSTPIINIFFSAQIAFYLFALTGAILDKIHKPLPLFKQIFYFTMTCLAQLYGFFAFFKKRKISHWETLRQNA